MRSQVKYLIIFLNISVDKYLISIYNKIIKNKDFTGELIAERKSNGFRPIDRMRIMPKREVTRIFAHRQ